MNHTPFVLQGKTKILFGFLAALPLSTLSPYARANVVLSPIFSDGMVLQRNAPVPIWGTADAGEKVTVSFGAQNQSTVAGADGKWILKLAPLSAAESLEMTATGKNSVKISNVAVGEVWLASGQSNMELRLPRVMNADQEIANANYPQIRMFRVGRAIAETPQTDLKGQWEAASPKTAADFTAVGYFFARELYQKLKVPIGLIHASYGGSPAEAWTSDAILKSNPDLQVVFENWKKTVADYPEAKARYDRQTMSWKTRADAAKAAGKPDPEAPLSVPGPGTKAEPSGLYNGMINPVIPYGIKGVIWYQGESNSKDPALYRKLFPALITSWRQVWGVGNMPFLWVQLANFHAQQVAPSEGDWALVREAQAMTLSLPNTGMACTIDIGNAKDIHYANKQEAGRRLALVALETQYGQNIEFSGPTYSGMTLENNAIRIKFGHSNGLVAHGAEGLKGFAIAGADHNFIWADAKIDGDCVIVSSPQVPSPTTVRYSWASNPIGNLYNSAGLPTVPFRTDPDSAN